MDLALNNLQRLICHKTQTTKQQTNKVERAGQWFHMSRAVFAEFSGNGNSVHDIYLIIDGTLTVPPVHGPCKLWQWKGTLPPTQNSSPPRGYRLESNSGHLFWEVGGAYVPAGGTVSVF